MAQTKFSEDSKFKGDRVESIILRRSTPRYSGSTDYDEEVKQREDRFFQDLDLSNVESKEDFELEFQIASSKIPLRRPPKRSVMPVKTQENFDRYFKNPMWRSDKTQKALVENLKRSRPKDIGRKDKKQVRGFATPLTESGEMRFITIERTGRYDEKGNPIEIMRVRDREGVFRKKSDIFDKF